MPEPFKNFFNPSMIAQMGDHFARAGDFDRNQFVSLATDGLEALELKERAIHIREALRVVLPDVSEAAKIMVASLHPETTRETENSMDARGIAGWAIMPMADYFAEYGLGDFDLSLGVLKQMTSRFTSEFAVRPFFIADQDRTLAHARAWAKDENFHVRRLASEGTRPRLPWGLRLQALVDDPSPILPVLEVLKDDTEEYVRRSVANNLNDIAKDHPDLIAKIAGDWLAGASLDRARLVNHACRSLIKQGHQPTLQALGYGAPAVALKSLEIATPQITLGEALSFTVKLQSESDETQPLILDFVIHHIKANGTTSPKVFKWKNFDLAPGQGVCFTKKHPIKPITTRVYYSGVHKIEIQINGQSFGETEFVLQVPD